MDFGGLDHLVSSYDVEPNPKSYRFKQQQSPSVSDSGTAHNQDQWKDIKFEEQRSGVSSGSQNMLSFCSPKTQQNNNIFCYYNTATAGVRGPFTSSQWMELEQQALIYKYMAVNAPVPSNLLVPIRKALETAPFSSFPSTNLGHSTYGWGGFHLGFSNNSDPEPGRCRRTDGKKWRCAKDAVVDQKYCERHMNRGRHRSRKHVETSTAKVSSLAPGVTTIISPFHQQNQHQINTGNKGSDRVQDSTFNSMLSPRFKIQLDSERSKDVNRIPVSWEASIGGPLGEVLNQCTNNRDLTLNLMTDGR